MEKLSVLRAAAGLMLCAGLLAACKDSGSEPLVPANVEAIFTAPTNAAAGVALTTSPRVRVTTASGQPVAGVAVTFAVTSGGGGLVGATQTTNANGEATVGSWTLGPVVGANLVTATVASLTPAQFSVTSVAGPAAKLGLTTLPSATSENRQPFATQPVVQIQDLYGNAVAQGGVSIAATIAAGGGSLLGTTSVTTGSDGSAAFTDLAIGGPANLKTLNFTSGTLLLATAPVNITAGPATAIVVNGGNNQSAGAGTTVPTPPSVRVTDVDGNGVPMVLVTFAVASGGGSITGPTSATNGSGVATVGSWTLGAAVGPNTMTATVAGLSGSPLSFSATALSFNITAVAPAVLAPGVSATITGSGFSATLASNGVTIEGVAATVTAAAANQLTVVVPSTMPCAATHDGTVAVTIGGGTATRTHPVQPGFLRTLAPGQYIAIGGLEQTRCNELSTTGGLYYISVHNTSETFSTTGAAFQLNAASATGSQAGIVASPVASVVRLKADVPRTMSDGRAMRPDVADGAKQHYRLLEENTRFLNANGRGHYARLKGQTGTRRMSLTAASEVGDPVTIRVPNLNFNPGFCANYYEITGRVVYQGTRAIIVEDNANPLAGTIDTTYNAIGQEFDATMFPLLTTNFGNPLAMDDVLDNNDRIIMVFTRRINDNMSGLGGFVVSCDLFARNATTNTTSNFGEYFYARVPTTAGSMATSGSPPRWAWSMRATVLHEAKHITSFVERMSRNANSFEASWLEESTARVSEELYERAVYNFAQRSNISYGSASNPAGPYCDVRPTFAACEGKPRGAVSIFEGLTTEWYTSTETHSPLGRTAPDDFSFYQTGWSLTRWAVDQSAGTEAAFLSGLTQAITESGVANLAARSGRTFAQMLPDWTLSMALDDYPGFSTTLPNLNMPSWNLRDVFAGLNADFPQFYPAAWPLVVSSRTFGAFTVEGTVLPGTAKLIAVSGAQGAKQLLELKANGSNADAPAELRIAIVRVQ
jgi:hypothetical protein